MPRRRSVWALSAVLPLLLVAPAPPTQAAPRIIMLYGKGLERPVFLTDWQENLRFMSAIRSRAGATAEELSDRSSFEAALFWDGRRWEWFVGEQAEQRGRFYPARGALPALFALYSDAPRFMGMYRSVGPEGLDALAEAGVPVSSPDQQ